MRYFVVHAHLYQPPRENPWSEVIPRQPSAAPFHDWNERVSDECYERLGSAAVYGPNGDVLSMVNLFGRMSFNIGPTLAAWLQRERPEVLLDANAGVRAAVDRTGTGPALMQPYGHSILPLCNRQEKRILVAWGRDDFRARFGRDPRGVWLPETAVDTETLEVCADLGLQFTILAPEQILQVRPLEGTAAWEDVSGGRCPTHRPLRVNLPSGRRFHVFAFHGQLSRDAAFGGILHGGERLLDAARGALDGMPEGSGLVLLASDGETFGHHQRGAESGVAEGLVRCRLSGQAHVTHLEEVLDQLPATHEARIAEPSAWSCAHGVGRWTRDCGCRMSHQPGWNQEWREPLRSAVVSLRDRVFSLIERHGEGMLREPWEALEAYGPLLAQPPSPDRIRDFLADHAPRKKGARGLDFQRSASLLELVRQVLFSATSCGWFFDDCSGIEPVQVMAHAGRAAELCRSVFGVDPEPLLLTKLANARSNIPEQGTGADVYRRAVAGMPDHAPMALAVHGLGRLREALRRPPGGDLAGISTELGLFSVDENDPPKVALGSDSTAAGQAATAGAGTGTKGTAGSRRKDNPCFGAEAGGLLVEGDGVVTDRRSGRIWSGRYIVRCDRPGRPVQVEIDGQPVDGDRFPIVAERALALGAERAATLLPTPEEGTLRQVAWAVREARRIGAPLPSPFMEAIVGGARGLLAAELDRGPVSPAQEIARLQVPIEAGLEAGVRPEEWAALRPALDRRLALLVSWVLRGDFSDEVTELTRLVSTASGALGHWQLNRTRRSLATLEVGKARRPQLLAVGRAAGLARDVWTPLDTPARRVEEAALDDLA